jgi:hypothetical protein
MPRAKDDRPTSRKPPKDLKASSDDRPRSDEKDKKKDRPRSGRR